MRPDCNATPSRIESGEDPLIEKRMSVSFSRPASSFHGSEVVSGGDRVGRSFRFAEHNGDIAAGQLGRGDVGQPLPQIDPVRP